MAIGLIFEPSYFGNSLYQIGLFFAAVVVSAVLAKTVYYMIKNYAKAGIEKSKTKADDVLLKVIEQPLVFFLLVMGAAIVAEANKEIDSRSLILTIPLKCFLQFV